MDDRSWKILLIEDDEDDFILTRSLLADIKGDQFHLDWIKTYEAGLKAFQDLSYDVFIVDYRLGEHDGLELVREALARGCKAPIILMTGQGSYDVDIEAMHVGATDYIVKGEVDGPLLERSIRYAIENKQAEEALRTAHDELEIRVQERTRELAETNEKLRAEIEERQRADAALRKSEMRFRTLAETTSSAIFILEDTKIRYANPAVRTITGYDPAELYNQDFWVIAHPTYQEILKKGGLANQWRLPSPDEASPTLPSRYEIKLLTKDGQERWVDITAGEMEFDGHPALVITAFDITERDQAEQALRKAKSELEGRVAERTEELRQSNQMIAAEKAKLNAMIENAPAAIIVTDPAGRVLLTNAAANRLFARPIFPGEEIYQQTEPVFCYPDGTPYNPEDLPLSRSALFGEIHTNIEMAITWQNGERRDVLINSAPIWDDQNKITGAVGIIQDITERKLAEEENRLNAARIEVQRRLIQNREMERLHIAQDIHDGPLQELIGIGFKLKEALHVAYAPEMPNERLLATLNAMQLALDGQIRDLRTFCSELRPPTLAPFGLEKAILSHAEAFHNKYPHLKLRLELMRDGKSLTEQVRLALFRIYQELLNNIVRHSEATETVVRFIFDEDQVVFEITDNGIGFEVPQSWVEMARRGHLGLVGVQERAEAVGGKLQIFSQPNEGTLVRVVIPRNSTHTNPDHVLSPLKEIKDSSRL